MRVKEYLKLSRSFNAVLTGVSPIMGAIAMGQFNLVHLLILFCIGFFGHIYGFVLNDILDYKIDKASKEISDRPLVSGTISMRNAWSFALISAAIAFMLAIYLSITTGHWIAFGVLILSSLFVTMYDVVSKDFPLTDLILGTGVGLLVLYGASIQVPYLLSIYPLAWIMSILGGVQVLFMNIVAGGLKDIENDFKKGANTLAVKLGVRVEKKVLTISQSFKAVAYGIQAIDLFFITIPFVFLFPFTILDNLRYAQWVLLIIISILMLFFSHKLLSQKTFQRDKIRKFIGLHYYTNFALVPILLMAIHPWALILAVFPALGFILSNLVLHGSILQPKTM